MEFVNHFLKVVRHCVLSLVLVFRGWVKWNRFDITYRVLDLIGAQLQATSCCCHFLQHHLGELMAVGSAVGNCSYVVGAGIGVCYQAKCVL